MLYEVVKEIVQADEEVHPGTLFRSVFWGV